MHLTSTSDDLSEKVPVESNCMPKSITKHYHLSSYSAVQYFSDFFFFDSKLHCEYSLRRKRNSVTASYRTQSTEQNSFGHRFMLRKSYKSCLNCKTKCSLSFQLNSRALIRQNHLEKEKYSLLKSRD